MSKIIRNYPLGGSAAVQSATSEANRLALTNLQVGNLVLVTYGGAGKGLYRYEGGTISNNANWILLGDIFKQTQSDGSITNNTTLATDSVLQFDTMLTADEWYFEFGIRCANTSSNTLPKFGLVVPAGGIITDLVALTGAQSMTAIAPQSTWGGVSTANTQFVNWSVSGALTPGTLTAQANGIVETIVRGIFKGGGAAGTVGLQVAQNSLSANATVIKKGSWVRASQSLKS